MFKSRAHCSLLTAIVSTLYIMNRSDGTAGALRTIQPRDIRAKRDLASMREKLRQQKEALFNN